VSWGVCFPVFLIGALPYGSVETMHSSGAINIAAAAGAAGQPSWADWLRTDVQPPRCAAAWAFLQSPCPTKAF